MTKFQACFKNFLAFFLGICLCVAVITFFEQLLKWSEKNTKIPAYILYSPLPYYAMDSFGIVGATPGKYSAQEVKESFGSGQTEFIYNVNYTIHQFGHRETPVDNSETRDRQAIFFGDSYVFGEGVNDNETIPYYFAQRAADYEAYNFSFPGDGPFDVLAKVENYQFDKILPHKRGVVFYVLLNCHVFRVKGEMREIQWMQHRPFYKRVNGEMLRDGNYATGRATWTNTLRFLQKSRILKKLRIERVLPVVDYDIKLTADTIESTFRIFEKKFPEFEAYLVVYPRDAKESNYIKKILKHLNGKDIKILDFSDLFDCTDSKYRIAGDGHPTPYANWVFAEKLAEDLGL